MPSPALHGSGAHAPGFAFSNGLSSRRLANCGNYNRGISVLDTAMTLAPLLGLLRHLTGMIRAFGSRRERAWSTNADHRRHRGGAYRHGIRPVIAIIALLPFNYLNSRLEQARQEIETSAAYLELLLLKAEKRDPQ